jgi:hypothetical protein
VELAGGVLAIGCWESENSFASCATDTSSAGVPDTSFGTSGLYTWAAGTDSLTEVATDSSHRLYLTGGTPGTGVVAERFSSGTTPDRTYGESGIAGLGCAGLACSVVRASIDADNVLHLLVVGDDGDTAANAGVLSADVDGNFTFQCCTYEFAIVDADVPLAFGLTDRHFLVARSSAADAVHFSALSYLRELTRARDLAPENFFGDGQSSPAVWTPGTGNWTFLDGTEHLGRNGDIPVPSYYGEARSFVESAVWRPENGGWYESSAPIAVWGKAGDLPLPGDYNGDGTGDFAVWRASNAGWYIKGQPLVMFGQKGDVPVPADWNGDGASDIAVWRPANQKWYLHDAPDMFWGKPGDVPVPGDYNGDGRTDLAIWRPQTGGWYVQGQPLTHWGVKGDVPVPGDYNGGGATDIAVWRPSDGRWYIVDAPDVVLGQSGDVPLGNEVLTTAGRPYLG